MSVEAQNNAARTHEEDLLACSSYVETDAGAEGQQNADVLGRLIVGAHARLDESHEHIGKLDARLTAMLAAVQIVERVERELRERLERVGDSLENVVAARLLDLREKFDDHGVKIARQGGGIEALTARIKRVEFVVETLDCGTLPEGVKRDIHETVDVCTACGHAAENHGGLGSVCLIGSCDCLGYTYDTSGGS
jgi:hypothetical protein